MTMHLMRRLFFTLLLALQGLPVNADLLVLVHGYLGSAASWEESGVNAALTSNGWHRIGRGTAAVSGKAMQEEPARRFYVADLPSLAPLVIQADLLKGQINRLGAARPDEPVILVGHSAGGVVARLLLVRHGQPHTKALITIASPHLGTGRAIEALQATNDSFPFRLVKRAVAGEIYDVVRGSRGVLLDLTPAQPGNLLHWLNRQPHPDIAYVSVLRTGPGGSGDELVPAFSQDMNRIPTLAGRSATRVVPASHRLQPTDGVLLAEILKDL